MANEPITREEILLNAVATGEQTDIKPITREEMFLAKLGGADVNTPMPITRKEQFLQKVIESGGSGGGAASVSEKDVNFYDYDGTCLYAYTVAEAQALSELPALPEQPGLICQGWNWSLEDIKAHNRAVNVGATYTTDDGTTRIYIHLDEGRTSPMLGVGVNGTVTVDWGDGTEPDVLTGTNAPTVVWTPNHEYAASGDYVIRLTVDGNMYLTSTSGYGLLRHSSSGDGRNKAYIAAISKVEIGDNAKISYYAFYYATSLKSITMPIGSNYSYWYAFYDCYSLTCVVIPKGEAEIQSAGFSSNPGLRTIILPYGVTKIGNEAFVRARMRNITIPQSVMSIGSNAFYNCGELVSVSIGSSALTLKGDNTFYGCTSLRYIDFSRQLTVPTLEGTNILGFTPDDLEIRVPAALYDEWIAATNWSEYAEYIVAV